MQADVAHDIPSFLILAERVLGQIVTHRDPLIPEGLRDIAAKAWDQTEYKSRHVIKDVADLPDVIIGSVGLVGAPAEFKIAVFNTILSCVRNEKTPGCLRMLLHEIDSIIGSLVGVLAIAEPFRSMSEHLESAMDLVAVPQNDPKGLLLPDAFDI